MDDNQRGIISLLLRDPKAMRMLGMEYIPTVDQRLRDSANNMDMGKVSALQRLFGAEVSPNTRVSEDFGALQSMRR